MTSAVSWMGQAYGLGAVNATTFHVPLDDAGAGVVNLVPVTTAGSATPTFTRASTAYARLSSGLFGLVASGDPRSMYSAAGVYLGYWPEEARADVLGTTAAIRRTMTDAGWVVGATLTVGAAVGCDGVAAAGARLTGGATAATNTILFTTVLGAAVRTYSAQVKRITGTGTVEMTKDGGVVWTDITASLSTSTHKLMQVTTASAANPVVGFRVNTNGDVIDVDFNTLEAASFANPTPIPINVSKAADVLTYPFAGNASSSVGTAYAEVTYTSAKNFNFFLATNTAQATGAMLYSNSADALLLVDSGGQITATGLTMVAGETPQKIASAWTGTATPNFARNGTSGAGNATFSGNIGNTAIVIGTRSAASGESCFGGIKNVRIWNSALSAAQQEALTA